MSDDLTCSWRSIEPAGRINCGCSGRKDAYVCSCPEVGGYVAIHATKIRTKEFKLYKVGADGSRRGDLGSLTIPICAVCPHRPGASEELRDLYKPIPNPILEPIPEPTRSTPFQIAIVAICGNCPRIDTKGLPVECLGPESESCPQKLWPTTEKKSRHSRRRGGCCG
jgi:hypothetical protein